MERNTRRDDVKEDERERNQYEAEENEAEGERDQVTELQVRETPQ